MKNTTQWMLTAALAVTALALTACPKPPAATQAASAPPEAASNASASNDPGDPLSYAGLSNLYTKNCAICHGKDMEGRPGMAPELMHEKVHWKTPEELAKYLADPQGYADRDARLKGSKEKYSMRMPAIPTMSDAERLAMAKWIINR